MKKSSRTNHKKPIIALLLNTESFNKIMTPRALERLTLCGTLKTNRPGELTERRVKNLVKNSNAIVTSWGAPKLTGDLLDLAPDLKIIAHAAGSVRSVTSDDVWKRRIAVTSAAPAIAESVAEFTLGTMITALAGVRPLSIHTSRGEWHFDQKTSRGLFDVQIGIVGAGFVGRHVISLLKGFDVSVLLYDPYVSKKEADRMGVTKASLPTLFSRSNVISLHAPAIPETRGMVTAKLLSRMKNDSILINTARGALIDEKALVKALRKRRFTAYLDVTNPEPPKQDNPLRNMENVLLTPHIAGLGGVRRLGDFVAGELERFFSGKKLQNAITRKKLERMA